jgi:hypothetical protein
MSEQEETNEQQQPLWTLQSYVQLLIANSNSAITNYYKSKALEHIDLKDDLDILVSNFIQLYRDTSPILLVEHPGIAIKDNTGKELGVERLSELIEAWYTLEGYEVQPSIEQLFSHGIRLFDYYVKILAVTRLFTA